MLRLFLVLLCLAHIEAFSMHSTRKLHSLNIQFLKDTHTICPDADYAPVWGLIFIEKNIAQQWYKLASKRMSTEFSNALSAVSDPAKATILKILSDQKNTATENLVNFMFHLVGESFTITNVPSNPVRQFTPKHIGAILRIIMNHKNAESKVLEDSLEKYLLTLNLLNSEGQPFKAKYLRPFVQALVGSLKECRGPNALYSANTTQGLLLGYMLAKSNTRLDLQEYFRGLLGNDRFVLPTEQYSVEELTNFLDHVPNAHNLEEFANYLCGAIYVEKYMSVLPKLVAGKTVSYHGSSFPACVESLMRNLINIVTYDSQTQRLGKTVEQLQFNHKLQQFYSQELCANNADVDNQLVHQAWVDVVENVEGAIYNNVLVQDASGQTVLMKVRSFCDGVIPVAHVDTSLPPKTIEIAGQSYQVQEKQVGNERYYLVPQSSGLKCCELRTLASNIVVIMNNVFNLKLYDRVEEVLTSGFAAKHFQVLCERFGWSMSPGTLERIAAFDAGELLQTKVALMVQDKVFVLNLMKGHGSVFVDTKSDLKNIPSEKDVLSAKSIVQSACVGAEIIGYDRLLSNSSNVVLRGLDRYVPIFNPDAAARFMQAFMESKVAISDDLYVGQLIKSMSFAEDEHFPNFVCDLFIKKSPDLISDTLIQALGVMASSLYLLGHSAVPMFVYTKIMLAKQQTPMLQVAWIKKALQSTHSDIVALVDKLIENHVHAATELIEALVHHGLFDMQDCALMMKVPSLQDFVFVALNKLISQDSISQAEVSMILPWIESLINGPVVSFLIFKCLSLLIDKNLIGTGQVDQVMTLIDKGMSHNSIQYFVCLTISSLIEKKLIGVERLLPLITKYMSSSLMELVNKCIEQGMVEKRFVDQLLVVFDKAMSHPDKNLSSTVLLCISLLFEKDLIGKEQLPYVMQLLDRSMNNPTTNVVSFAVECIIRLIKKDLITSSEQVNALLPLLEKGMLLPKTQYNVMHCLSELIQKKLISVQQIEQLWGLMRKGMSDEASLFWTLQCFSSLVDQDLIQGDDVKELLPWLQNAMNSGVVYIPGTVISLINTLIKKDLISVNQVQVISQIADRGMHGTDELTKYYAEKIKAQLPHIKSVKPDMQVSRPMAGQGMSSMLRFNRSGQRSDEKLLSETKRYYSTQQQKAYAQAQAKLMEQERAKFDLHRQSNSLQVEPLFPSVDPKMLPSQLPQQNNLVPVQTPEQIMAAARMAAQRKLPRTVTRGLIR